MCGIIAYVGHRSAIPLVVEGLEHLEYRGYDSSGIAFVQQGDLHAIRASGKLSALKEKLGTDNLNMSVMAAMGHTRWATHGAPTQRNAHPHFGGMEELPSLALIHNGIVENYQSLKELLLKAGYVFHSDTDTEVLAHLIAEGQKKHANNLEAFAWALRQVEGTYAVACVFKNESQKIYAARKSSPLVLGLGIGEFFVASDIPAFLKYTKDVVFLHDGELVVIDENSWNVCSLEDLSPCEKTKQTITWDMQAAQKEGYKHFMLKEIFEQPRVIRDCLAGRIDTDGLPDLSELDAFPVPERLHIVACGTSYNAGLWAQYLMESWAKIPVCVDIASEFRYRDVVLHPNSMVLFISQSGETADTLAALRLAKSQGFLCTALCNVVGSSMVREADTVLYTQAGPEISVASTKAMCSQMIVLALMALYYAKRKGVKDTAFLTEMTKELQDLPEKLATALPAMRQEVGHFVQQFAQARSFFFLGRGHAYPLALEGALKLKELSYIHAEGYASGEMKHGPIALIDQDFPTFALVFDDDLLLKNLSNIKEIEARHGPVLILSNAKIDMKEASIWKIPSTKSFLQAFIALPAVQLFSYEMADYLGKDVDQPRNLAKSVTVE